MDSLDHKKPTVSTGHEDHEVHLCHRCGWPFPNPHPSARHRRSHRRVCGTIEGYEIIQSKSDDHKLAVSDDDDTSDEGETPSPKVEKKIAHKFGSSGGLGENSHRSEDDVFSDAITEFSDGVISPQLEERFEQLEGMDKNLVQKTVEGDLSGIPLEKADETAEGTEQLNGPASSDPVIPVDKSESVPLITDTRAEPISVAHGYGLTLKDDLSRSETQTDKSIDSVHELGDGRAEQGLVKAKQVVDIQREEDKLASVTLDSEDGKTLDPALVAVGRKEVPCDNLVNEVVKHYPSPTETLEKPDATSEGKGVPTEVNGVHISLEVNGHSITDGHTAIADETRESINSSMGITKVSDSAEVVGVTDPTEGRNCSPPGNETGSQEAKDKFSGEIVSPSPCEVDVDARHLEEVSRTEDSLVEVRDSGFQRSLQESEACATDLKGIEPVDVPGIVLDLKHNVDLVESEKPSAPLCRDSEISSKSSDNEISGTKDGAEESESGDAAEVGTKLNPDGNVVVLSGKTYSPTLEMQEAKILNQDCLKESSPDTEVGNTSEDIDGNPVKSEKSSFTPILKEPVPSPLDVRVRADNSVTNGESVGVDNKSLQDEGDLKLTKEDDGISAWDLSGENFSISDSLEGKCGSVSDKSEINVQAPKMTNEEGHPNKSDVFEPPSFMTLVQPGGQATSEIETVQNKQQAGWFPSLTNVVNESEGRKKNEEIIAKVTNWSQGKQQNPLKNLLSEAKSQNTKETSAAPNKKDEAAVKDNGAAVTNMDSSLGNKAGKDQPASKEIEKEWDSPARYPTEIKKEKKKKSKPYWVPFVCCSSVHRDL